jgi:hypothetical protein
MPCFHRPSPSGTSAPFTHTTHPPSCVVPKWSPKSSVPKRLCPQLRSLLPILSTARKPLQSNSRADGSIVAPTSPSKPVSSTNAAVTKTTAEQSESKSCYTSSTPSQHPQTVHLNLRSIFSSMHAYRASDPPVSTFTLLRYSSAEGLARKCRRR